ncbi:MAG: helix-turn-helix transcriptional regulator [Ruminococcus sp.]|nr:helix-turn-helix transcriptional regulator [Candidatus Apopatosoma intestinale]
MNIKIGTIIKKLRTENEITQDTLASAIGVTPQAVSRWESGGSYPDIELLPVLADFFSVSTDELLGYKISEREAELKNIKNEVHRLATVGASVDEFIAFARKAYSRFPSDYWIKERLASYLYYKWRDTQESNLFDEIKNLCDSVIAGCENEYIRHNATGTLIDLYLRNGNTDKMTEIINRIPEMRFCREFEKACGIGDGNTELYVQEQIDRLTFCLANAIRQYATHNDLPNDRSTWDKKIEMFKVANQLYQMIYGDNLMIYHAFVSDNYRFLSTYQIAQGKEEETLDSLEKMCYHAVESDKSFQNDHGKHYTSIFTDKLTYEYASQDTYYTENWTHSKCYNTLCKLKQERYDSIRNHPRFIAVVNRLTEYDKEMNS